MIDDSLAQKLLVLPDLREDFLHVSRSAQAPDLTTLKGGQMVAYDEIMEFLSSNRTMHVLKGYAGTGKTYLVTMILDYLLTETSLMVGVTAPTNKAVKVLRRSAPISDMHLEFCTCHSMLGLRPVIYKGKQIFKKLRDKDVKVDNYQIIFVDEVSMLDDKLFMELQGYLSVYNIKVIFIGDPAQIPPVGSAESIPLDPEKQKQYGMQVSELTEIVRQAKDSPIIKTTMDIRNNVGRPVSLPVRESSYSEDGREGVFFLETGDRDFFFSMLNTYFNSENFRDDADFAKVIAWTNKTVDSFNTLIRKMIYGKGAPKICEGEKLVADSPIVDKERSIGDQILYTNNDEFEVVSYTISENPIGFIEGLKHYKALVVGEDGKEKIINICHEDAEEDFEAIREYYKKHALANKGSFASSESWRKFYECMELVAQVKYNYAITAHKAQGSTYENVVVMEGDIDKSYNVKERNRIKYTACSRPSKRLYIAE